MPSFSKLQEPRDQTGVWKIRDAINALPQEDTKLYQKLQKQEKVVNDTQRQVNMTLHDSRTDDFIKQQNLQNLQNARREYYELALQILQPK